jgi:translation initiation factor IF-3
MDYGNSVPRGEEATRGGLLKQIQVKEVKFDPELTKATTRSSRNSSVPVGRRQGQDQLQREMAPGIGCDGTHSNDLEPYAVVESWPRLEGRQMVMLLAPKKTVLVKPVAAGSIRQPS